MMKNVFLLFAILIGCSIAQTCPIDNNGELCNDSGECIVFPDSTSYCACSSGTSGDDCGVDVDGCDLFFSTVEALETDDIPIDVTADYTADTLTVTLTSPLVTEREWTTISMNEAFTQDKDCTYPGNYWERDFDGCADFYIGAMPWAETRECGWRFDDTDAEWFIYETEMIVNHFDLIDPFAGRPGTSPILRETQHVIPLLLQFQKFVEVATTITVTAPVNLLVAITRQEVDPETLEATLEFTTNLPYPYILDNEILELFPTDLMDYVIEDVSNPDLCIDDPTTSCTQLFRITIDTQQECEITGSYGIEWDIDCHTSPEADALCAVADDETGDIVASVISEDFCAQISVAVDVTGTLSSYDSDAYDNEQATFIIGSTSYFEALIDSPDATLTSSTTVDVTLTSNGFQPILLYTNGVANIPESNFQIDTEGADFSRFLFDLTDDFIPDLGFDGNREYTVTARIDVTYEGVPGTKRLVFQQDLNERSMGFHKLVGVAANPQTQDEDIEDVLEDISGAGDIIIAPLCLIIPFVINSIMF